MLMVYRWGVMRCCAWHRPQASSGYTKRFVDGYGPAAGAVPAANTVPLSVWYSHTDSANFVGPASVTPPDGTCKLAV